IPISSINPATIPKWSIFFIFCHFRLETFLPLEDFRVFLIVSRVVSQGRHTKIIYVIACKKLKTKTFISGDNLLITS
ncbi:hypothetical protein, partial [Dulcicalothrix desertica]|uniref:hypothetical protein n=1 Tax=Dulcicalothrix desertica TaxID=32056 RepID=UPI001C9943CA